jgi:hypothetical protein
MFLCLPISENQRRTSGCALLIFGSIWFILTFFWFPPFMLILDWFHLPKNFYAVLLPGEFVMSAILCATGIVLWNSAAKQKILDHRVSGRIFCRGVSASRDVQLIRMVHLGKCVALYSAHLKLSADLMRPIKYVRCPKTRNFQPYGEAGRITVADLSL